MCKIGEDTFNNGWEIEACVKIDERNHGLMHACMHKRRVFYNLPSRAYQPAGDKKTQQQSTIENILTHKNFAKACKKSYTVQTTLLYYSLINLEMKQCIADIKQMQCYIQMHFLQNFAKTKCTQ